MACACLKDSDPAQVEVALTSCVHNIDNDLKSLKLTAVLVQKKLNKQLFLLVQGNLQFIVADSHLEKKQMSQTKTNY